MTNTVSAEQIRLVAVWSGFALFAIPLYSLINNYIESKILAKKVL